MRRLYLQIYATFVAILLIFLLLTGIAWTLLPDGGWQQRLDGVGAVIGELVLPPEQSQAELEAAVDRIATLFSARVTVGSATGEVLAAAGEPLPIPSSRGRGIGFNETRTTRSVVGVPLPDGRWFMISWQDRGAPALILTLGLLAIAIALGALPVTRRITRRLERLQTRVEALGAGELSTRVEIEGKDEVADLARSFNRSADKIERLVEAQRHVLAGVSHEIRTPLTRMRVALELLEKENRPELRERLLLDIAELDELIGELLLASRLDTIEQLEHAEDVDLLALLAEEAARTGAEVSGEPVTLYGDPRMLRRLIRNLLENARRYAPHTSVEASAEPGGAGGAIIKVADRGPGIPEHERDRIFEPYYRAEGTRTRNDRSVGLGLALVRRIANRHDGDVSCLPRGGGGTIFTVNLRGAERG
jgi:signal transduction histidine kinase